jgi:hypothetical protein
MSALIVVQRNPLLRVWGIVATVAAMLLLLRGAWLAAAALFVLSPAPAMMFARRREDRDRVALTWIGVAVLAIAALAAEIALVVGLGGIPPMHEWAKR